MASSTPSSRIDEFAAIIRTLPEKRLYEKQDLCTEQFKIYADSEIEVFYAPFDAVAESAKVAIVGITPGFQQMEIGFRFARSFLLEGHSGTEACVEAKRQASFAGQMRKNLVDMLDEIGLPGAHGLSSSGELFGSEANQLHTTSALRYPVFVQGENYTGHKPSPSKHPRLRQFVSETLGPELAAVPNALIVPLGKAVEECLDILVRSRVLGRERCVYGFPHPSPGNGHRRRLFAENRNQLQDKIRMWFSGRARATGSQ